MKIVLCEDDDQVYEVDGHRVPRVTSVIAELYSEFERSLFELEWLASLRGDIVHQFTHDVPAVDFVDDPSDLREREAYEYAMERCRWSDVDDPEALARDVAGRVRGWKHFVREEVQEVVASEYRVAVPGYFAGTVDKRLATRTWGTVTADLKPRLSPFVLLQLAAYVYASIFMAGYGEPDNRDGLTITAEQAEAVRGITGDRRLVVVLDPKLPKGYKAVSLDKEPVGTSSEYERDRDVFLGQLAVFNWKKTHGRLPK